MPCIRVLIRTALAALVAAVPYAARAADSTVSALTAAGALDGTELLYCAQGAADRKCTAAQVQEFAGRRANPTVDEFTVGETHVPLTGTTPAQNRADCFPYYERGRTYTFDTVTIRITTAGAAGTIQIAFYADNSTTNRPTGTPLATTADISTTATGAVNIALSSNIQIGPLSANGVKLWQCSNILDATTLARYYAQSVAAASGWQLAGSTTNPGTNLLSSAAMRVGVTFPQTYGTWPNATGQTFSGLVTSTAAMAAVEVFSVP